jgi:uncharacterized lipoprotein YmbA
MNGYYPRFALAWLVSVCVGCTSAPVRYYTLTPSPDKTLPASKISHEIDVRVVHTPPELNRSELMVRTGPTELTLLENERWASPVTDEIKDALRLELERRLAQTTGSRPAFTKVSLDIDVQHLEAELGRYALLQASWSATLSATGQPAHAARTPTCTFQAEEKIPTVYAGMVEGYQREIGALAGTIVAVLTSPAGGIDAASCPKSIEDSASKEH